MVSALDSARLSTALSYLHAITVREDGVSSRFGSTLGSTQSLTCYNSQRKWRQLSIQLNSLHHRFTYLLYQAEKMALAIDSARLPTSQIHLLPIAFREYSVSYRFGSTLYGTNSLTYYNSQRRWCQLSIQIDSLQHRFTYLL
jgi:hypothetical protein